MKTSIDQVVLFELKRFPDVNGTLAVAEGGRDIPFDIKRIFYVYGAPAASKRGEHAHRKAHQVLICLKGRCRVACDDGAGRRTFLLDSPVKALHVPPSVWAEEAYETASTILMVLSDRYYEESDYIRDRRRFLAWRRAR